MFPFQGFSFKVLVFFVWFWIGGGETSKLRIPRVTLFDQWETTSTQEL